MMKRNMLLVLLLMALLSGSVTAQEPTPRPFIGLEYNDILSVTGGTSLNFGNGWYGLTYINKSDSGGVGSAEVLKILLTKDDLWLGGIFGPDVMVENTAETPAIETWLGALGVMGGFNITPTIGMVGMMKWHSNGSDIFKWSFGLGFSFNVY